MILCVVVVGSGCSAGESAAASAEQGDDTTPVAGWEVTPHDMSRSVQVSGTVQPVERFRINSYAEGVLTTLRVQEGDRVQEGELLAATQLAELRAELRRQRAEVDLLEQRLERKLPLVDRELIGGAEVEELRAELQVAERQLDVLRTRIGLGERRSPADAVVIRRHVDPGSTVAANEPLLELADVSTLVVPVRVSERDVAQLERDQSVEVTVDAYPGETISARIRRVFPAADPDSRRVTVELALEQIPQELQIRPGYRARATLEADRREDIAAIPSEALLASGSDDKFVYVIEEGTLAERRVETGVDRRNLTEITDGLEQGEVIVGTNPTNLREQMAVHVSQWIELE